jgi:type II secretory pathway pseudopilin PulG
MNVNFKRGGQMNAGRNQRGYILLTLMLMMALLVIGAAVIAPTLAFEIRRDREEEMVHRGVQYSRAIRAYASKTGRYPLKLEDLKETGGVKYIRKLYKDPITGGDFRLLHMSDMPTMGGATNLNAQGINPSIGGPGGSLGVPGVNSVVQNGPGQNLTNQNAANQTTANQVSQPAPEDENKADAAPSTLPNSATGSTDAGSGGVIFGVASRSKLKTIREYNQKNHYNDWMFFYYPPYGGTFLTGPTSLTTTNVAQQAPATGANQPPGSSPFSNPSSLQNQNPGQNLSPPAPPSQQ